MPVEMALIVVSHGEYAKGAVQSAEMILGPQSNVGVVSLTPQQGREDVVEAIEKAADALDTTRGLLLLVDLKGGTPGNAAGQLVLTRNNVHAFCGFNLAMLMECLTSRDGEIEAIEESIRLAYEASYCNLGQLLKGGD